MDEMLDLNATQDLLRNTIVQAVSSAPTLVLLSGGSTIKVATKALHSLSSKQQRNLRITLTDERFGEYGHEDSNWRQLLDHGLALDEATTLPILQKGNVTRRYTTETFERNLHLQIKECSHIIALFGIGVDSHIAGILPESDAVRAKGIVCDYDTPLYQRITVAPAFFDKVTEAIVYMEGDEKKDAYELLHKPLPYEKYPDQLIKRCKSYRLIYNQEGI